MRTRENCAVVATGPGPELTNTQPKQERSLGLRKAKSRASTEVALNVRPMAGCLCRSLATRLPAIDDSRPLRRPGRNLTIVSLPDFLGNPSLAARDSSWWEHGRNMSFPDDRSNWTVRSTVRLGLR